MIQPDDWCFNQNGHPTLQSDWKAFMASSQLGGFICCPLCRIRMYFLSHPCRRVRRRPEVQPLRHGGSLYTHWSVLCELDWYLWFSVSPYRTFSVLSRLHSVCAGSVGAAICHQSSTWCRMGGWIGGAGYGTAENQQNWREGKTGGRCGGSTRGKQSGPSENHPQNNLYQNSFCQQILWRESPFRQKNLLMHFRAHINSTGALCSPPTNTPINALLVCSMFCAPFLVSWPFSYIVSESRFVCLFVLKKPFFEWTLFFKAFLPHGYKTRGIWFTSFQMSDICEKCIDKLKERERERDEGASITT